MGDRSSRFAIRAYRHVGDLRQSRDLTTRDPYACVVPGPRNYTTATRTALGALSRGTCYYPDCERPVVVLVDGEPYVDYQVAHIHDANPGNRYDPDMSDDDRRAFKNLIFLCKPHHDLVDKRHPDRFPPEVLREWKVTREGDEINFDDTAAVTEDVIEEALSEVTLIRIESGGLHLGGAGGSAIGAGGGGGGVIGSGTAGPGGPGASVEVPDEVGIDLAGGSGRAPGAGGGGGLLPGVLTRRAGPSEGRQGRGYSAGVDGQDGQPTSFDHEIAENACWSKRQLSLRSVQPPETAQRLAPADAVDAARAHRLSGAALR